MYNLTDKTRQNHPVLLPQHNDNVYKFDVETHNKINDLTYTILHKKQYNNQYDTKNGFIYFVAFRMITVQRNKQNQYQRQFQINI